MLSCFGKTSTKNAIPIKLILQKDFNNWIKQETPHIKNWLSAMAFKGKGGDFCIVPHANFSIGHVILVLTSSDHFWEVGSLPYLLPEGNYFFEGENIHYAHFACTWGLGAYYFSKYKALNRRPAKLVLPKACNPASLNNIVEAIYLVRDLINIPTEDLGPSEFAAAVKHFCKENNATFKEIVGEHLLTQGFPLIHTVGRASDDPPRFLEIEWGNKKNPNITLVGKGVCFDSGGLDIKLASAMLLMKKDMGGAANVLGLAQMIIRAKLPIFLKVLIPVVENVISGNAYRPGDIIKSRKGLTVEIGNTDAEGRVILADALTYACESKPDLLIDLSTLTGAARVALGTDLPAVFSPQDQLVDAVINASARVSDPIWRLPLFAAYREALNTPFADINNAGGDGYAGAITAALFLKEFVSDTIPWLHYDMMAWNLKSKPGRPQGGEAMAIRGLFHYLSQTYV